MSSNLTPRRTHRKRVSALRRSTDTFSTLPEYPPTGLRRDHIVHSDQPPDYPDCAEEADEDTDSDLNFLQVPRLLSQKVSPKRAKRFLPSHNRRHSPHQSPDPHLDSLLERSVHALEMSNNLLQSSISTRTSLSTLLALDSPPEFTLEDCAHNLSSRITNNGIVQASWAEDLQEISKNVEDLFREDTNQERRKSVRAIRQDGATSCSLPSSSLTTMRKSLRRPSLDLRQASDDTAAENHLHYSPHSRAHLIAQCVASTQDSESILLLSKHASSSSTNPFSTPSLPPKLTDKPSEPSTPAYTMLSSFVYRAPSSGSPVPSSLTSSFMSKRRNFSNGSASTERGHGCTRCSCLPASLKSLDKSPHRCCGTCSVSGLSGSLVTEPGRRVAPPTVLHRPMTPPVEDSSSSSDSCVAKRTVQSLRKILDDQPKGRDNGVSSSSIYQSRLRAPPFLPRSSAPVADTGTSTATASISHLLTKGTHSSSSRPPSPQRQSAMKRSPSSSTSSTHVAPNRPNSSLNFPLTPSFPEVAVQVLGGGSTQSSGMSTPSKRISFAELPESYASTRPNGDPSSKFKDKHNQRKRKNRLAGGRGQDQSSPERTGWWNGWLTTGGSNMHGLTMTLARQEEQTWGERMGPGFSSNLYH